VDGLVAELALVAFLVFLLNLPFGYWRAGTAKLSRPWFIAVHAPIPFVIAIRLLSGLGYSLASLPVTVGAYFLGQYLGGLIRADRSGPGGPAV
jgi:hypothetical protein